ncbi:hypothetical protein AXW86_31535 [Pseudomonas aeruginosa]|nr:hypothetical protein AXW86_31535 [Pseudomonas aeruginosa]
MSVFMTVHESASFVVLGGTVRSTMMAVAAVVMTKQVHQRTQQQDRVWQQQRDMTVVLSRQVEQGNDQQHTQGNTGLAAPKGRRRLMG